MAKCSTPGAKQILFKHLKANDPEFLEFAVGMNEAFGLDKNAPVIWEGKGHTALIEKLEEYRRDKTKKRIT